MSKIHSKHPLTRSYTQAQKNFRHQAAMNMWDSLMDDTYDDMFSVDNTICLRVDCINEHGYMLPFGPSHHDYEKLHDLIWGGHVEEDVVIAVCPECLSTKWVKRELVIDPFILKAQRRKDDLR